MKKLFIALSFLLLPTFSLANSNTNTNTNTITTTCDNVPVQISESSSQVIMLLPNSTELELISKSGNGYNIKYNDTSGWVYSRYVSKNQSGVNMDELLANINDDNVLNLTLEETAELVTNTPNYNYVAFHERSIKALLKVEGVEIFPIEITKPEGEYVLIATTFSQDYASMYPLGSVKPGRRYSEAINVDAHVSNYGGDKYAKTVTIPETTYVNGVEINGGTELYETFYSGFTITDSKNFKLTTGDGKPLYLTPVNGRNVASVRSVMCINGEERINNCIKRYEKACFAIRFTGSDGKQYVQVALAVGGRIGWATDYNGKSVTAAHTTLAPNEGELIINDLTALANSTEKQEVPVIIPEKGKEKENKKISREMYHDLFYNVTGYKKEN